MSFLFTKINESSKFSFGHSCNKSIIFANAVDGSFVIVESAKHVNKPLVTPLTISFNK